MPLCSLHENKEIQLKLPLSSTFYSSVSSVSHPMSSTSGNIVLYRRSFARQKTILLNVCDPRRVLFLVITFPLSENRRSQGTDVAGIARYLRAISASIGSVSRRA